MRLIPRGRGRHVDGVTTDRPAEPSSPRSTPRAPHPRQQALIALAKAGMRAGLHVERGYLAVRLSRVGVQPITIRVDYQRGAWCYVWTTQHGPRDSIGPVSDPDAVIALVAHALYTRGAL